MHEQLERVKQTQAMQLYCEAAANIMQGCFIGVLRGEDPKVEEALGKLQYLRMVALRLMRDDNTNPTLH